MAGSAAAPAARCRKFRRGSFIVEPPSPSHHSITSSASNWIELGTFDAECSRGLHVDNELELGRLQDRQVGRLGALEDLTGVDANLTKIVQSIGPVAH